MRLTSRPAREEIQFVFVFLLQLRDTAVHGRVYLFTIFVLLVWAVWLRKVQLLHRYTPFVGTFTGRTTVVIPVVDEPAGLFGEVLSRITRQGPDEVIVVINGPRNVALEQLCESVPGVEWTWTAVAGKRKAVALGVAMATGDVVVLVDSDTIWTRNTLSELVKPFADERVGGASTRQHIIAHDRHVLTRWADWMEGIRNEYAMPAMSVLGTVGCLPGRTIAFRRSILVAAMPRFLSAKFLGVFLEVSDDRTLTNEALRQGYRTVYQHTSVVYTDAPISWRKMARQQFRWARGSQYNTLRMLPWMLRHARTLAFFYICDILVPFLLVCTFTGWALRATTATDADLFKGFLAHYGRAGGLTAIVVLTIVLGSLSSAIRQSRHLKQRPSDLVRLPAFILISTFFLMPIRLFGFARMAYPGSWGTRKGGYSGERARNLQALLPVAAALVLVVAGTAIHP